MPRKTKTSTTVVNRYKSKTYKRYTLQVRIDSELYKQIESFLEGNFGKLNGIMIQLLSDYFKIDEKRP